MSRRLCKRKSKEEWYINSQSRSQVIDTDFCRLWCRGNRTYEIELDDIDINNQQDCDPYLGDENEGVRDTDELRLREHWLGSRNEE